MNKYSKVSLLTLSTLFSLNLMIAPVKAEAVKATELTKPLKTIEYVNVKPLEMVDHPANFLHKTIKATATFDKFTTLGLDYKPAFRNSQKYISFLIKREDVAEHNIPLSELKLLISREKAEKHIDIESGDKIEFTGKVFSNALNDPWVEVDDLKIISPINKDTDKDKKASK